MAFKEKKIQCYNVFSLEKNVLTSGLGDAGNTSGTEWILNNCGGRRTEVHTEQQ